MGRNSGERVVPLSSAVITIRSMTPTSTPIPLDHPRLPSLLKQLGCGGTPISIPHWTAAPLMQASDCYRNVAKRVQMDGGRMRVGWMLRMLPETYLCAEHHAVWETPEGQLVDVTQPANTSMGRPATTLLLDERVEVHPDRNTPNVKCRFVQLTDSPRTAKFIECYGEFHAITQRALDAANAGDIERFQKADNARTMAHDRMVKALERLGRKAPD